jgi:hypothetical protein
MATRIIYIESKPLGGRPGGPARIGRIRFSQGGKILYCAGQAFEKLGKEGKGKANYADLVTGEGYWISGCKKRGGDRLIPGTIEIDEDVREEYWTDIRNMPESINQKTIRSTGKKSKK